MAQIAGVLEIQIMAGLARISEDMRKAERIVGDSMAKVEKSARNARTAMESLTAGFGAMMALQQIKQMSDAYTKMDAQLRISTKNQQEYNRALADVQIISTVAQTNIGATTMLYTRLLNVTKDMNISQGQVSNMTKTVSYGLKAYGATAAEASSASLQLSQAMGANRLGGEEFRAVMEAMPNVMKVLADSMGVPLGELRALSIAGKITADQMLKAWGNPEMAAQMEKLARETRTIGGELVVMSNNAMQFVGSLMKMSGAQGGAIGLISGMSEALKLAVTYVAQITSLLITLAAVYAGKFVTGLVQARLATMAMTSAGVEILAATVAQEKAYITSIAATMAANRASIVAATAKLAEADAVGVLTVAHYNETRAAESKIAAGITERVAAVQRLAMIGKEASVVNATIASKGAAISNALVAERAAVLERRAIAKIELAQIDASIAGYKVQAAANVQAQGQMTAAMAQRTAMQTRLIALEEAQVIANGQVAASTASLAAAEAHHAQATMTWMGKLRAFAAANALGLIGVALWGIYTVADQLGWIDKLSNKLGEFFETQNSHIRRLKDLAGGGVSGDAMGRAIETVASREAAKAASDAQSKMLSEAGISGPVGAGNITAYIDKLTAELAALDEKRKRWKNSEYGTRETENISRAIATLKEYRVELGKTTGPNLPAASNAEPDSKFAARVKHTEKYIATLEKESEQLGLNDIQQKMIAASLEAAIAPTAALAMQVMVSAAAWAANRQAILDNAAANKLSNDEFDRAWTLDQAGQKLINDGIEGLRKKIDALNDETIAMSLSGAALREYNVLIALHKSGLDELSPAYAQLGAELRAAFDNNDAAKAMKSFDDAMDPSKAQDFGTALKESFGAAGNAIQKMTKAFTDYGRVQSQNADRQKEINAMTAGSDARNNRQAILNKKSALDQIGAYGDMASAAKGFFTEGSEGYRLLHEVEQVYRAFQFIASVAAMGQSKVETASKVTDNAAKTTTGVMAGAAEMFAQSGWWGFAGVAAMLALMASLGHSGGGGGGATMPAMEKNTGTGTVLGDSSAASSSVERSLTALVDMDQTQLSLTNQMVSLLGEINVGLGGVAKGILKQFDISGKGFGTQWTSTETTGWGDVDPSITNFVSGLSGTGISFGDQSVGAAMKGVDAKKYEEISRYYANGAGLESVSTTFSAIDPKLQEALTGTITSMADLITKAGTSLGATPEQIKAMLEMNTGLGNIDFTGKTGEEIQAILSATFSAMGDTMATTIFPAIEEFQKLGEGTMETLLRVAAQNEYVNATFKALGLSTGLVGLDAIKANVAIVELFGGLDQMSTAMNTYTANFYSAAEQQAMAMASLNEQFAALGVSAPTSEAEFRALVDSLDLSTTAGQAMFVALMNMSGAFASAISAADQLVLDQARATDDLKKQLFDLSHTQAEQMANNRALKMAELALQEISLGLAAGTLTGLQAQIDAQIDLNTAAAAAAAAIAAMTSVMGGLATRQQGLDVQLLTSVGDSAGALALARRNELARATAGHTAAEIAEIRAAYEQIYATEDQITANNEAAKAAQAAAQAATQAAAQQAQAATQLKKAWQSVTDTIFAEVNRIRGLMGTRTSDNAQSAYDTATVRARAGDQDAAKLLPALAQALLAIAESSATTAAELARARGRVAGSLEATGTILAGAYGTSLPSFAVGTNYLPSDMIAQLHEGERIVPRADNIELMSRLQNPSAANDALVSEIKSLREELKGLREEARATAGHTAATTRLLNRVIPDGDAIATRAAA